MNCSACNGKGHILEVKIDEEGHEIVTGLSICSDCNGKGEV